MRLLPGSIYGENLAECDVKILPDIMEGHRRLKRIKFKKNKIADVFLYH